MRAYLLPASQMVEDTDFDTFKKREQDLNLLSDRKHACFVNAKTGIRYLMEKYNLQRNDEVWITTTSDSPFVSSCVTCTVFNHCKVSRVFTEKTRMIWVIHEFGFPHPELQKIITVGKEKGIPVVEDSAHALQSVGEGGTLGFSADYGLFSLPKIFPVNSGGLLIGDNGSDKNTFYDPHVNSLVNESLLKWLPFVSSFAEQRQRNYTFLKEQFSDYPEVYDFTSSLSPFVFGFKTPDAEKIYQLLDHTDSAIEFARTYNADWVLLPVNALLSDSDLKKICDELFEHIEKRSA
ncbi:MAG: DegT/DnrJ/EryC1/StrS family aminotransferase [Calditrichota bacterium]